MGKLVLAGYQKKKDQAKRSEEYYLVAHKHR